VALLANLGVQLVIVPALTVFDARFRYRNEAIDVNAIDRDNDDDAHTENVSMKEVPAKTSTTSDNEDGDALTTAAKAVDDTAADTTEDETSADDANLLHTAATGRAATTGMCAKLAQFCSFSWRFRQMMVFINSV
jgi:hypothetical protein